MSHKLLVICKATINTIEDSERVNRFINKFSSMVPLYLQKYNIIIALNIKSNNGISEYNSHIKKYNDIHIECMNIYEENIQLKHMIRLSMNTFMLTDGDLVTYFDIDSDACSFSYLKYNKTCFSLDIDHGGRIWSEKDMRYKIENIIKNRNNQFSLCK
jgi:hypothetical protein